MQNCCAPYLLRFCLHNQSHSPFWSCRGRRGKEKFHANCELISCNRARVVFRDLHRLLRDFCGCSTTSWSFQLIYWSSSCEDVNHLSLCTNFSFLCCLSFASSISSKQSLSSIPVTSLWQKICSLCTAYEDEGEAKREIIKQICEISRIRPRL